MTADSVRVGSGCKDEWVWALKYKKPIIPVRLDGEASLPFRLSSRQFVDFSVDFDAGLAQLRSHLRWAETPEGALRELRDRLADAERELPRADATQQPRGGRAQIEQLTRHIEEQRRLVEDPQAARRQTDERIATGLERQRQPERPVTAEPQAVRQPAADDRARLLPGLLETALIVDFCAPRAAADVRRGARRRRQDGDGLPAAEGARVGPAAGRPPASCTWTASST